MPIVKMDELLKQAENENRAVGAFSVGNMEMVIGAVTAAEKTGTPIILQIAEKRLEQSPMHLMAPMMVSAAESSAVPIAVHLDHGLTLECIEEALDFGFTSVMLDASLLPLSENIELTKKVVELARQYDAATEAELGVVGGNEGDSAEHTICCTDPAVAKMYCDETGVDCLAVAIGNAHGNYAALPQLRFDILAQINDQTTVPLVLHGGTGVTDDMFRQAIALGVRKINIATASFDALANAAKSYALANESIDYFKLSPYMAAAVCANVQRHINVFNNQLKGT